MKRMTLKLRHENTAQVHEIQNCRSCFWWHADFICCKIRGWFFSKSLWSGSTTKRRSSKGSAVLRDASFDGTMNPLPKASSFRISDQQQNIAYTVHGSQFDPVQVAHKVHQTTWTEHALMMQISHNRMIHLALINPPPSPLQPHLLHSKTELSPSELARSCQQAHRFYSTSDLLARTHTCPAINPADTSTFCRYSGSRPGSNSCGICQAMSNSVR